MCTIGTWLHCTLNNLFLLDLQYYYLINLKLNNYYSTVLLVLDSNNNTDHLSILL